MIIFANNAVTTLAAPLLAGQTTLTVLATTGELFPVPGVDEYFKLTLEDRRNRTIEITHCTGRAGDVLTIVRAQEDTLALDFALGSTVANRFTRASAAAIIAQVTPANPWYLGPFAVAPTLDNEGNPLVAGMQYFNTTDNIFYVWTGASWVDQNNGTNAISSVSGTYMLQDPSALFDEIVTDFNLRYIDYAAAVQTPDVTIAEQFLVWLDGVRLKPGTDYTIPVLGTIRFTDPPTADQSFTGVWIALTSAGGGGGVTDGDKGDITVSGVGAVWTIDAQSVTLAKMAHIATDSILGRVTAAAGVVEVLTPAQVKTLLAIVKADISDFAHTHPWADITGEPTTLAGYGITDAQALDADLTAIAAIAGVQGDIIYRNAASWVRLPAGTSGWFLKTQGAAADPIWDNIPGGGDALVANPLSQFAATTSLQLKGVMSDETGSGALVFANSPALVTPTGIVKGDVGLGNVDNTSDANKPVSTATQTALDLKVTGPAGAVTDDVPAVFDGTTGELIKQKTYVAFKTLLALVKGDVGLGNVDNTSDAAKPVSTATQTALDLKAPNARQIISGAGLTGGGDLSADRTLAVGAGVGLTVNADDVAITIHTQAEAEAGLDNTKVMTALRTAQAIAALSGGGGGGTEIVAAAPAASQNNYAPATIDTSKDILTILELAPTAFIKITGISTTGWGTGKRFVVRNTTLRTAATGYSIIFDYQSASSSAANRFRWNNPYLPLILQPDESAEFYYNGTELVLLRSPSRHNGYFDTEIGPIPFALAGLNSASLTFGSSIIETGVYVPNTRVRTGSVSANGAAIFGTTYGRWLFGGSGLGCMGCLATVQVSALSDAAQEYMCYFGLTSHYLDGFNYASAVAPTDLIGWRYERTTSTSWQQVTRTNSVETSTAGDIVAVAAATPITFYCFVNGNGTRVDFAHSTDGGKTWTLGTSYTSNISLTQARGMDLSAVMAKKVGTADRELRIMGFGLFGGMR